MRIVLIVLARVLLMRVVRGTGCPVGALVALSSGIFASQLNFELSYLNSALL